MKRTVEVAIMGQKFLVRSESDDGYVQKIAQYVNDKIADVTSKTKSIPSLNVAILAAMNIADELIRDRDHQATKIDSVSKKIHSMLELIDLQL